MRWFQNKSGWENYCKEPSGEKTGREISRIIEVVIFDLKLKVA
jgi:hypothetical protein